MGHKPESIISFAAGSRTGRKQKHFMWKRKYSDTVFITAILLNMYKTTKALAVIDASIGLYKFNFQV